MFEIRRMRATDDEIQSLIADLVILDQDDRNNPATGFTVNQMAYASECPVVVKIAGRFDDGRELAVDIQADRLVAAFLLFCGKWQIPICQGSAKSVTRISGGIAFDMVVRNLTDDPNPVEKTDCVFVHDSCANPNYS